MAGRRDKGTGSVFKANGRWRARVRYTRPGDRLANRGQLQTSADTKAEAREALERLRAEAMRLEITPSVILAREEQTLGEWLLHWHERRVSRGEIRAKTAKDEARLIRQLSIGVDGLEGLGHERLNRLSQHLVADWFDRLGTLWTGQPDGRLRTREQLFGKLRSALNDADVGPNPCTRKASPKRRADAPGQNRAEKVFSEGELRRLLDKVDETDLMADRDLGFACLVWTLSTTGCRIGEALGLLWHEVNLEPNAPSIRIEATLVEAKGTLRRGPTKTGQPRSIGLPGAVADRLRRLRVKRGPLARLDDYVFSTAVGTPQRRSNIVRRQWHPLLDELGFERCGFHKLRHTHGSRLVADGRPITEVSHRLGHSSPSTTLAIYAHAMPDSDRHATAAVSSWFEDEA
jgi:integrase